ncbi:Dopamine N-acetyltransferase [Blattella germanica]|nr:Dopamine N-acetyltransferase [Blattella germanica]
MDDEYDIVPATIDDTERIAEFMRQTFCKYEPLNMSIGAPPNRPTETMRSIKYLSQGTSLMTITRSGLIIGVAINGESSLGEKEEMSKPNYQHESYKKIDEFFKKFESGYNVWELTGTDRGLFLNILSVDPIAGGKGIGKAMMKKTREIAKAKGYPLLGVLCTSHYSARIAKSIGMECVYRLPYSEYKNENGEQVFVPPPPHKEAAVFVQKLSS